MADARAMLQLTGLDISRPRTHFWSARLQSANAFHLEPAWRVTLSSPCSHRRIIAVLRKGLEVRSWPTMQRVSVLAAATHPLGAFILLRQGTVGAAAAAGKAGGGGSVAGAVGHGAAAAAAAAGRRASGAGPPAPSTGCPSSRRMTYCKVVTQHRCLRTAVGTVGSHNCMTAVRGQTFATAPSQCRRCNMRTLRRLRAGTRGRQGRPPVGGMA